MPCWPPRPGAFAQQYSISTVAGGAPFATPAAATSISIGQPRRVALDSSGNVYFTSGNCVYKMSGSTITLVAGNSRPGFSGDGGPAINAQLNAPQGVAVDKSGNVYISDTNNNRVRMVTTERHHQYLCGYRTSRQPRLITATAASPIRHTCTCPAALTVDSQGNLYIADTGDNTIREITADGIINTIAGNGLPSYSGDGYLAVNAELHSPEDVAVDSSGNVYIADTGQRVYP